MMRDVTELLGEGVCIAFGAASTGVIQFTVETWDDAGENRQHRVVEIDVDDVTKLIARLKRAQTQARRAAKGAPRE